MQKTTLPHFRAHCVTKIWLATAQTYAPSVVLKTSFIFCHADDIQFSGQAQVALRDFGVTQDVLNSSRYEIHAHEFVALDAVKVHGTSQRQVQAFYSFANAKDSERLIKQRRLVPESLDAAMSIYGSSPVATVG